MNQNIHETNQKNIKRQKMTGTALAAVGLILFVLALVLPFATYGGFIWFLNNNISVFSNYRSLPFAQKWQQTWELLREYELMGDFFKCLGNGYLFMIVAAVAVYSLLRRLEK